MKKIILFVPLIFLSILNIGIYAQDRGKVVYRYKSYAGYEKEMELLINEGSSLFRFHKTPATISLDGDTEFYHYEEMYTTHFNYAQKEFIEQRILKDGTKVLANWPLDLQWEITEETKSIDGYTVQKAITLSYEMAPHDSDWDYGDAVAWFTMDIPISTGPERYTGLPGLILELSFTKRNNTGYFLKEIIWDVDLPTIEVPSEGIKITKKEILRPFLIDKKWLKKQKKLMQDL